MGDLHPLPDGPLGEHIRFADEVSLIVQDLQRGQQEEGVVRTEGGFVGAGVYTAILGAEGIILFIQQFLLSGDHIIGVVLRLILNEPPNSIPDLDQALHPIFRRD